MERRILSFQELEKSKKSTLSHRLKRDVPWVLTTVLLGPTALEHAHILKFNDNTNNSSAIASKSLLTPEPTVAITPYVNIALPKSTPYSASDFSNIDVTIVTSPIPQATPSPETALPITPSSSTSETIPSPTLVVQPQTNKSPDACWATPKNGDAGRQAGNDNTTDSPIHPSSVSVEIIQKRFDQFNSPWAHMSITDDCGTKTASEYFYDLTNANGFDANYALAQTTWEDGEGTQGEARWTHNPMNIRPSNSLQPSLDHFRYFSNWTTGLTEGLQAWVNLLKNLYVKQWHLTNLYTIIPVYAPSGDDNNPTSYINGMGGIMHTNTQDSANLTATERKALDKELQEIRENPSYNYNLLKIKKAQQIAGTNLNASEANRLAHAVLNTKTQKAINYADLHKKN